MLPIFESGSPYAGLDSRVYMIVILALVAAFLGLRLYSVLGKRTGHEQAPAPIQADDRLQKPVAPLRPTQEGAQEGVAPLNPLVAPKAEAGVRAIIAADRSFDLTKFVEGARSAYGMILEAFWSGKRDQLAWLCDSDVAASFESAIAEREAAGHVLDNRLIRIEHLQIVDASLVGRVAHVTLQFDADIAAVTRDKDGDVVGGSMTDAVESNDIWTFTRDISQTNPNWKLSETDEAA
jgi:predicted lipid-binding transport protein (Tim44 family)